MLALNSMDGRVVIREYRSIGFYVDCSIPMVLVPPLLQNQCHHKVLRLLPGISSNSVPVDQRKFNGRTPTAKSASADAYFTYFYWHFDPCP